MSQLVLANGSTIQVIEGSIVEHQADVLVNSTLTSLDLDSAGPLSRVILRAAGEGLQEECTTKYPGGFKEGEVAVTGAYNLPHKAVYHVYCPPFSENALKNLEDNVWNCLVQAGHEHHLKIVFPALGCGGRSYPVDQAAQAMLATMVNYLLEEETCIESVDIVIRKEDGIIGEVFRTTLDATPPWVDSRQHGTSSAHHLRRWLRRLESIRLLESKLDTLTIDPGPRIRYRRESILVRKVDVIVYPNSSPRGGVSAELVQASGAFLQEEYKLKYPNGIQKDEIAVTHGYNLPCHCVYHVRPVSWGLKRGKAIKRLVSKIEQCVDLATNESHSTIAFPVLGLNIPADILAKTMVKQLRELRSKKVTTLKTMYIVIHPKDADNIKAFDEVFNAKVVPVPASVRKSKSGIAATASASVATKAPPGSAAAAPGPATVFSGAGVPATSSGHISDGVLPTLPLTGGFTLEIVIGSISEHKVDIVVNSTSLSLMPNDAGLTCRKIFEKAGTKLVEECQTLYLNGIKEDELAVTGGHGMNCKAIYHIYCPPWDKDTSLKKLEDTVLRCLNKFCNDASGMESIAFPALGTGGRQYPKNDVAETMTGVIRRFYNNEQRQGPEVVQIVLFDKDTETIQAFTEHFSKEERTDSEALLRPKAGPTKPRPKTSFIGVPIKKPPTWSESPEGVVVDEVDKTSQEYRDVEGAFLSSKPADCTAAKKIFRVQNKELFTKYMTHKLYVDQRYGEDSERMLWHGTSKDAIPKINKAGFNRSYCGKNNICFGQGVYFALQSWYSAQDTYSVPDVDGIRYIYRARVCVGRYTVGNKHMRVPPPLDIDPHVTFDTLVNDQDNPFIFVAFHDDQAYPEYIIHF